MIEKSIAMELVLKAFTSGYAHRLVEPMEDRLFFTPEAMGTLGNTIGFISGMWLAGQHEAANKYADDFLKWLDYLCPLHIVDLYQPDSYGSRNRKVPGRVCQIHSDGTTMGFSLAWYLLLKDQQQQEPSHQIRPFGIWDAKYIYQMNGGLLFHGSNQENYAVTMGNTLWQIHT